VVQLGSQCRRLDPRHVDVVVKLLVVTNRRSVPTLVAMYQHLHQRLVLHQTPGTCTVYSPTPSLAFRVVTFRFDRLGLGVKCLPTRHSATASAYLWDVFQTFPGSAAPVVLVTGGSTCSEEITISHPLTNGNRPSTAATVEERPNGLRTMDYLTGPRALHTFKKCLGLRELASNRTQCFVKFRLSGLMGSRWTLLQSADALTTRPPTKPPVDGMEDSVDLALAYLHVQ